MRKEILIDNVPVELQSSAGWLYIYQEEFGHDIMVEIMPFMEAGLKFLVQMRKAVADDPEADDSIFSFAAVDASALDDFFAELSAVNSTTIINVFWALAKNADPQIPPVRKWINGFERFPVDEVIPPLFRLLIETAISKKKAGRILQMVEDLKTTIPEIESQQTESQSQQSIEG